MSQILEKPADTMTLEEMLMIIRKARQIAEHLDKAYAEPIIDKDFLRELKKHQDLMVISRIVLTRLQAHLEELRDLEIETEFSDIEEEEPEE